jgi:hypothetical protein
VALQVFDDDGVLELGDTFEGVKVPPQMFPVPIALTA